MVTIADASHTNLATLILECTANVLRSLTRSTLTDKRIHHLPAVRRDGAGGASGARERGAAGAAATAGRRARAPRRRRGAGGPAAGAAGAGNARRGARRPATPRNEGDGGPTKHDTSKQAELQHHAARTHWPDWLLFVL